MTIRDMLIEFTPCCEQERADRALMLRCMDTFEDLLTRANPIAHFTASSWIVNAHRDRVLMAWHNIYQSWAWTGGHADGEADLMAVAVREAEEESGLHGIRVVDPRPLSIEILPVNAHFKRGQFVSPHLHLNLTWLLEADDHLQVHSKPDENSAVAWFSPREAVLKSTEADMRVIYEKLNQRAAQLLSGFDVEA